MDLWDLDLVGDLQDGDVLPLGTEDADITDVYALLVPKPLHTCDKLI
jgi:hypothetical protein